MMIPTHTPIAKFIIKSNMKKRKPQEFIETEMPFSSGYPFYQGTDGHNKNDYSQDLGGFIGKRLINAQNLEIYNSIDKVINGYMP